MSGQEGEGAAAAALTGDGAAGDGAASAAAGAGGAGSGGAEMGTPGTPGAAGEGQGGAAPSWLDGLTAENRGRVEGWGYGSLEDMVSGHDALMGLKGVPADQLIKMPADPTKPGAMNEVWQKLGRPEEATGYTNKLGDEHADDFYKGAAAKAHEHGLTNAQFSAMQEWFAESMQATQTERRAQIDSAFETWSREHPQDLANVQKLMGLAGIDAETLQKGLAGDATVLYRDVFAKAAAKLGESGVMIGGDTQPSFQKTPEAAAAEKARLMADEEFVKGANNPEPRISRPYLERLEALNKIIVQVQEQPKGPAPGMVPNRR